ncbi:MAG: Unknown protein [uncultured Sulfurovum sp.]|uniref:Pycsar effector protein domain-containing protein n=1 Tax=uncultured Sulfurovum sp. TaxID=269237 RepID=A0A6S6TA98_9BACT|nr:MAG: Unknown protein [uncultured Sulfurovum sp.]
MNDVTLSIYTLLQDIFKNVWEQQKYSEVKNGVLLTFSIALFAILIRVYFKIELVINSHNYSKIIFFLLILFFMIHIVLILQSFFPNDSNKEDFKEAKNINIFFFGDIQKVKSTQYLDLVIKKVKPNKEDINTNPLLDLANQIVKLSEITQFKYTSSYSTTENHSFLRKARLSKPIRI